MLSISLQSAFFQLSILAHCQDFGQYPQKSQQKSQVLKKKPKFPELEHGLNAFLQDKVQSLKTLKFQRFNDLKEKKMPESTYRFEHFLVKAAGIEPASESNSTRLSPSAAFPFKSRVSSRRKAG